MEITLKEWLALEPHNSEVKGDARDGFYLGIENINKKIGFLESHFQVATNELEFSHFLFNTADKKLLCSGSIALLLVGPDFKQRLVGAATFNVEEYDPNTHYAATCKSLCKENALKRYPQFGANLNNEELIKKYVYAKVKTSNKVAGFVQQQ